MSNKPDLINNIPKSSKRSAFAQDGFECSIDKLYEHIQELYLEDKVPWIIGYSGGKDSTAVLQLIWQAVLMLPKESRHKEIHVITTDTMVENPIVSMWVERSHKLMQESAKKNDLPLVTKLLRPNVEDSFWVNLIGKGYPAPRHKFRWCTERLKIRPSNAYISSIVSRNGEAILAIGARKAESTARAAVLNRNTKNRIRDLLSPSGTLPGCLIYTPIEAWTNDDVWIFLNRKKNPWGHTNKDLLGMYQGASKDGECPLVVDDSTPSCGDSRFGCWVCTLVEKDRSMTAMIQNDEEKEWMMPLLDLRNKLDFRGSDTGDRKLRDFRRMSGAINIMNSGQPIPGPYKQKSREKWLRLLLEAQTYIRENGPPEVASLDLITQDELEEIRRIWVIDKHEIEDRLPTIYCEVTDMEYKGADLDDDVSIGPDDMIELKDVCEDNEMHYELTRELLSVTRRQQSRSRRAGLFDQMEKSITKHFYEDEEDALNRARTAFDEKQERSVSIKGQQDHKK